jgi:hypothetical protein
MIRYALACDTGHEFESWFPESAAYEAQVARGLVTCPICDSAKVEKQIMAPSIARKDKAPALAHPPNVPTAAEPGPEAPVPQVPAAQPQPMAVFSEREREFRAMVKAFREHVTKNADYVGKSFADEARKMHYGDAEQRSIYGEANLAEAKELIEEGIEVQPLPIVPDERN